jgi:hypothetical protein
MSGKKQKVDAEERRLARLTLNRRAARISRERSRARVDFLESAVLDLYVGKGGKGMKGVGCEQGYRTPTGTTPGAMACVCVFVVVCVRVH